MKFVIEGNAKEIAALLLELAGQHDTESVRDAIGNLCAEILKTPPPSYAHTLEVSES